MGKQQLLLGKTSKKAAPYVDDVFSGSPYIGNSSNNHYIQNGVNLSDGGLVWMKERAGTSHHILVDSEFSLNTSNKDYTATNAQTAFSGPVINSFEEDGFKLHHNWYANNSNTAYASWSFAKKPGFFDVIKYDGDGQLNRSISHSLKCKPGCIVIKNLTDSSDWVMYHRSLQDGASNNAILRLNTSDASFTQYSFFNDTVPTATHFVVNNDGQTNQSGKSYMALIWAGGESSAATARSAYFNGASYLDVTNPAFNFGTGDLTIECWVKPWTLQTNAFFCLGDYSDGLEVYMDSSGNVQFFARGSTRATHQVKLEEFQWAHIAVVRQSGDYKFYVNGLPANTGWYNTQGMPYFNGTVTFRIGSERGPSGSASAQIYGQISNVRVCNSAVYTEAFVPSTTPLESLGSNTILLCCNGSTATSSTVTPSTITAYNTVESRDDSPFDDPGNFVFGENQDKNIIKCGRVTVAPNKTGAEAYLGFEPQWIMWKEDAADNWDIYDSSRMWNHNKPGDGKLVAKTLLPNDTNAEADRWQATAPTSTGFNIGGIGTGRKSFYYVAIRTRDGHVGKPTDGNGAFHLSIAGSSTPSFQTPWPGDFALYRNPYSSTNWTIVARKMSEWYLTANDSANRSSDSDLDWDHMNGFRTGSTLTNYIAWNWRRGPGFDVTCYVGDGNNTTGTNPIPHQLGKIPEMIWIKKLSSATHWSCYHHGLNSGNYPYTKYVSLNNNWQEDYATNFNDKAPTADHFYVGEPGNERTNKNNDDYIAFLFASANDADGNPISKVSWYTGTGSDNTVSLGFSPRFLLIKRVDADAHWILFDTLRGVGPGLDERLFLNATSTANSTTNYVDLSGNNIVLKSNHTFTNASGGRYIYYAHA